MECCTGKGPTDSFSRWVSSFFLFLFDSIGAEFEGELKWLVRLETDYYLSIYLSIYLHLLFLSLLSRDMYTYAHSSLNLCNLYLILFLPQNNSDGEFSDGLDEFEESRRILLKEEGKFN